MLQTIIIGLLLLSVVIFAVPKKIQYYFMLFVQILMLFISSYGAITVFHSGEPLDIKLFELFGNKVNIVIDSLSAFFILVINTTVLTGALYAKGYLAPYLSSKTKTEMAWHHFQFIVLHFSLLLVSMLREGISFMVIWEMMSVSAFFLIIFESEKQEIKDAGIKFMIQMHIALVFILSGFIVSSISTNQSVGFETLTLYFSTQPVLPVFVLFFIGFGIKAGFIPLHTWLVHAHPAAPSHISGVMSGVIIKMGIYGILRVLTYIHTDLLIVGVIILLVSIVSGILGVVIAIVQHDYKRLLAYHSIENIGIIGIGIGLGVIGLAVNNPILASLGFAGGILHVLNHSLFKSLLFYSAGSVYQQTHTKNIEHLGKLQKKMPFTTIFFLIGAVAICGLPPFNGFISEFLIYSGLFKSLSNNNLLLSFMLLGAIIALVLIGGLAIFCFTKVFSIMFLGNERSDKTAHAQEVESSMLFPKLIISILIISIGVLPFSILKPLSEVISIYTADASELLKMNAQFTGISYSLLIFVFIVGALLLLKIISAKKHQQEIEPTWGCGYTGANPAVHQYTATSYAGYIVKKARLIVGVKKHFTPLKKDDIFPKETEFETHNSDVFETTIIEKPVHKILTFMEKIAVFQTGNIQHYLLYAILFIIFIAVITFLNII